MTRILLTVFALSWALGALAQSPATIAAAKQEGEVVMYTSGQQDDMAALTKVFEQKYGVKVTIWRSSSEKVLQRAVTEARSGRHAVDVLETNGPELETAHREGLLQKVDSPHLRDIDPVALRPHGEWVGTRMNVFALAYNTKSVKKEELPKSWEDLLQPRWKGRLGIEADDSEWLAGVLAQIGEQKGIQLFRDIVKKNGISVRKGHTLLTQLVVSGEVPLALTVYNYKAEQLKKEGAPIEWFAIGRAVSRPNGVAATRKAPHPNAAALWLDFEISEEGQKILAKRDFVTTNKKTETALNKIPLMVVDPKVILDEQDKWTKLYEELFLKTKVIMGKESHYSSKKDRVFVRGIQGQYSLKDELKRLRALPRVIKGRDLTFNDGPQSFSKHFIEPVDGMAQTLHVHLEEYAPGGRTQKHGHVNEAAFYILDGTGYEVHDGVRYDWKAGDVAIVHMNCVHQHFNASTEKPARALVMKPKPLIMFMNMLFQQSVIPRPKEAACPAGEGYQPRNNEANYNHE